MKLINFQSGTGGISLFGVVIKGHAVSFKTLLQKSGQTRGVLSDVYSYLENLLSSEDAARELLKYGEENISSLNYFFIYELRFGVRCLQHNIISHGTWYMKSFQTNY